MIYNTIIDEISDWRFERKFVIPELSRCEVENIIIHHPAMFSEIYNQRFVNNVYLDSVNLRSYYENVEGLSQRMKVRVRWYGDLCGDVENAVLELKIKSGFLGSKKHFQLKPFSVANEFDSHNFMGSLFRSGLPDILNAELKLLSPVLINHYTRNYFQSSDKNYRITVDTGLRFYRINRRRNWFVDKLDSHDEVILELKYKKDVDHLVDSIANVFPFRLTKSSKYVFGIEMSW